MAEVLAPGALAHLPAAQPRPAQAVRRLPRLHTQQPLHPRPHPPQQHGLGGQEEEQLAVLQVITAKKLIANPDCKQSPI